MRTSLLATTVATCVSLLSVGGFGLATANIAQDGLYLPQLRLAERVLDEAEAVRIRSAKGDIDAERSRLYADADAQAEALLADGRERLGAEMADIEARAEAELASAAGRSGDELRAEIARYSSSAIDSVVTGTLDDAAQQDLIEGFIARVGASS